MRNQLEINLEPIKDNINEIRKIIPSDCEIIAVLFSDAYGHGDVQLAKYLESCGIKSFAVSDLDAAQKLRRSGVLGDVMVLSYVAPDDIEEAADENVIIGLISPEHSVAVSQEAQRIGKTIRAQLAINTGMNRFGFDAKGFKQMMTLAGVYHLPGISLEGIYSDFSSAEDSDRASIAYTKLQFERFKKVTSYLNERGMPCGKRHIASSASAANYPGSCFDAVRCGLLLFGYNTSLNPAINVKPLLSWEAVVASTRDLDFGDAVSYGRRFSAKNPMKIATVCIGYADGLPKALSGKGYVLLHGKKCPIIGDVCMEHIMIDISGVDGEVRSGDLVTVIGTDGELSQTAEDLAKAAGCSVYEILTGISERVPRSYKEI